MIDTGEWWMLRERYEEGVSISALAKETGYDRKTVRKYIHNDDKPVYKPREPEPSLLDPYKDYIKDRVAKHDLMATRILREIRKQGYRGGYTILQEYIHPLRIEHPQEAVYRYETKPGVQAQVDFDPMCSIMVDGQLKKLYCFSMILSFSRYRFTQFTVDACTEKFLGLLLEGFRYFNGYPEEILFDNIKQVVLKRTLRYEDIEWNAMFEDLFKFHGFKPRLCKPRRPETKGKVENQVKLVWNDFFKDLEYNGLPDLNGKVLGWCDEVNSRLHRTTHAIPRDRLKEEGLTSLTGKPPYQIVRILYRKISRDCFVSCDGNRYSVPWKNAGMHARLLIKEHDIKVEVAGHVVCEHMLRAGRGAEVRTKEHFDGLLARIRAQNIRTHMLRVMKLPGVPDVERRPLSIYDTLNFNGGGIDG